MAGLPLKASPLRLRQALAAHGRGHRRARCAARFNGCRQCRRPEEQSVKLLYYYWNQPSQPKLAQSVPMGVLEGLGGVGHALGTN